MNKLLGIILVALVAVSMAANSFKNVIGDSVKQSPIDVDTVVLFDNAATAARDTFDAYTSKTFGPYRLTAQSGQPMYKGFSYYAKLITGTTPTMSFRYQVMPFNSTSDTTALWTAVDTLDATGMRGYVDLSSQAGKSIMFEVFNYDDSESQIPDWFVISFKKNFSYTDNR